MPVRSSLYKIRSLTEAINYVNKVKLRGMNNKRADELGGKYIEVNIHNRKNGIIQVYYQESEDTYTNELWEIDKEGMVRLVQWTGRNPLDFNLAPEFGYRKPGLSVKEDIPVPFDKWYKALRDVYAYYQ